MGLVGGMAPNFQASAIINGGDSINDFSLDQFMGKKYVAGNGAEGEPGTFKDRFYLEKDPHRFLEGAMIAAEFIKASNRDLGL